MTKRLKNSILLLSVSTLLSPIVVFSYCLYFMLIEFQFTAFNDYSTIAVKGKKKSLLHLVNHEPVNSTLFQETGRDAS